jgi:hypothetical protein
LQGTYLALGNIEILEQEGECTDKTDDFPWIARQLHNGVTISSQTRLFATSKKIRWYIMGFLCWKPWLTDFSWYNIPKWYKYTKLPQKYKITTK